MMARYHISLVSTSPDTSYLFRDSSSKTNQHFLDSKESYSPQVKSLQKLFNFLISQWTKCSVASDFTFYDFEYYIFADVQGGSVCWCRWWGTPTAASVSSSPTSTAGTYQVAVRVLWHEGGGTHDEREDTRQCETKNHSFQLLTIFREWIVWEQTHFPS